MRIFYKTNYLTRSDLTVNFQNCIADVDSPSAPGGEAEEVKRRKKEDLLCNRAPGFQQLRIS